MPAHVQATHGKEHSALVSLLRQPADARNAPCSADASNLPAHQHPVQSAMPHCHAAAEHACSPAVHSGAIHNDSCSQVEGPATAAVDKLTRHTLSFVPLASALRASWRSLRIKRTCKLFSVVQGTCPHSSLVCRQLQS